MFTKKDARDVGVTILALGVAYGLGVVSCVYWELKLIVKYSESNKVKKD